MYTATLHHLHNGSNEASDFDCTLLQPASFQPPSNQQVCMNMGLLFASSLVCASSFCEKDCFCWCNPKRSVQNKERPKEDDDNASFCTAHCKVIKLCSPSSLINVFPHTRRAENSTTHTLRKHIMFFLSIASITCPYTWQRGSRMSNNPS